jgi:hypothetical protein
MANYKIRASELIITIINITIIIIFVLDEILFG